MEATVVFKCFADDLESAFPDIVKNVDLDIEKAVEHIEKEFFPHVMKIIQKDESFFNDSDRILFGINLSQLFKKDGVSDKTRQAVWMHLQMCLLTSLLHGDIKDKIGKILSTMKTVWSGKDDEISKILNDDNSKDNISNIIDFILQTQVAKIFMEVSRSFKLSDFELNLSDPQEFIEIAKNPDHPICKKIISKINSIIADKIKTGYITQQQLSSEVEAIKAKVMSVFGEAFSNILGGTKSDVPTSALLGNSVEARRQRMLARLQKKQRDKKSS
jgi:hypothetical protein